MEYYAYYSADHELRDDYTDDFILYMEAYYPGYGRIFHNIKEHRILIMNNGKKEPIEVSEAEEASVRRKALYDQSERMVRDHLMKKLADRLPAGITVVFNDILSLGDTPEQIAIVYEYLMRKKIYMEFVYGRSMSSENILLLSDTLDTEISKYLKAQIQAYCDEVETRRNMPAKLSDRSRLEKKELQ